MRRQSQPAKCPLAAAPGSVTFRDHTTRNASHATIAVRNVGLETTRVVLTSAHPSVFAVSLGKNSGKNSGHDLPEGDPVSVAPGMVFYVHVRLQYEVTQKFTEVIVLKAIESNTNLEIPMVAMTPGPNVVVDIEELDFGTCIADGRLAARKFKLRNLGSVGDKFTIRRIGDPAESHPGMQMQIRPQSGTIGPAKNKDSEVVVYVELSTNTDCPRFTAALEVLIGRRSSPPLTVRLNAAFRMQRLRLIEARDKPGQVAADVAELDLGCAYYDTVRTSSTRIFNDGPDAVNFSFETCDTASWTYAADGSRKADQPSAVAPADVFESGMLTVRPVQGTLAPGEQRIVLFDFCPSFGVPLQGWSHSDSTTPRRDYLLNMKACAVGMDTTTEFRLTGAGVSPMFSAEPTTVEFTDCEVGMSSAEEVVVTNHSDSLPLSIEIGRIAHYSCKPDKFVLAPRASKTIVVTFVPRQVGSLRSALVLMAAGKSAELKVHLVGVCARDMSATHRGREFGLNTTARLLKSSERFTFGLTSVMPTKGTMISGPDGRQKNGIHTTANPNARLPPLKPDRKTRTALDPSYAYSPEETRRKKSHEEVYERLIKDGRKKRIEREDRSRVNDVSALEFSGGLGPSPTPRLDEIPPISPTKRATTPSPKKIKKLSPSELRKVVLHNSHRVDLGNVCEGSTTTSSLDFTNNLDAPVTLQLRAGYHSELKVADTTEHYVNPGESISFAVQLTDITSHTPRRFSDSLEYTVNGVHTAAVIMHAMVVQPTLSMSSDRVVITVGSSARNPQPFSSVALTNPLGHPVEFAWSPTRVESDQTFAIVPTRGIVPPNSQLSCTVELTAEHNMAAESTFDLSVTSSDTVQQLTVVSSTKGCKCLLPSKRVVFGEIGVGSVSTRTCTILNQGAVDAFFSVSDIALRPEDAQWLTVTPSSGIVRVRDKVDLLVSYTPQKANKFDGAFKVNIRDGETSLVIVSGQARPSTVTIDRQHFRFSPIAAGATTTEAFTLRNAGKTDAALAFDLVDYPAFKVKSKFGDSFGSVVRDLTPTKPGARRSSFDTISQKGSVYGVEVAAGESLQLLLEFSPKDVAAYDFSLPISVNGCKSLTRRTVATVLSSALTVSTNNINFDSVIAQDEEQLVQATTSEILTVTWTGQSHEKLMITEDVGSAVGNGVVKMLLMEADGSGKGLPLRLRQPFKLKPWVPMSLMLTFDPNEYRQYASEVKIRLAEKGHAVLSDLSVSGRSLRPYVSFSATCVDLPIVRPGEMATGELTASFNGYAAGTHALECRLPLDTANCPLVVNVADVTDSDDVSVVFEFAPKEVCSFNFEVEFYDRYGTVFPLRVSGGADTSMFTARGQLSLLMEDTTARSAATRSIARWLSSLGLPQPTSLSVPESLVKDCGKRVFDTVAYLSGREVPGIKLVRPNHMTTEEALSAYTCLLNYLASSGGILGGIEASSLLPLEHFRSYKETTIEGLVSDGVAETKTGIQVLKYLDSVEEDHGVVLQAGWTAVMMQVVRTYVLARVTAKLVASEMPLEATTSGGESFPLSGYCEEEERLLRWISAHRSAVTGQHRPVTDFCEAMADGTALVALLLSYVPFLQETELKYCFEAPTNVDQYRHNACCVIAALKRIGAVDFCWHWTDITSPEPCYMVLALVYLLETLPQYRAYSEPIRFSAPLGEAVTKRVTVANPADKAVSYSLLLVGSSTFTLSAKTLKVAGKGEAVLEISFNPIEHATSEALLHLVGRTSHGARAAVLTFGLVGDTVAAARHSECHVKAKCYEKATFGVPVKNLSGCRVTYTVSMNEVSAAEAKRTARRELSAAKRSYQTNLPVPLSTVPKIAFEDNGRRSMWTKVTTLTLNPGESTQVECYFCPSRLGDYRGALLLTSDVAESLEIVVTGFSGLPQAIELQWKSAACTFVETAIPVPYANEFKVAAVKAIPGALNPQSTKNLSIATTKEGLISEKVLMKVGVHYRGAKKSPFRTPTEFTLCPATPSRNGKFMATHITKSSLVDLNEATNLKVHFDPVSAMEYIADVVLTAHDDIRIYTIKADVIDEVERASSTTQQTTETTLTHRCAAQQESILYISVPNPTESDVAYDVLSDLPSFTVIPEEAHQVPAGQAATFQVEMRPDFSGEWTDTKIMFVSRKHIHRVMVDFSIAPPEPAGMVELCADETECAIQLANPTDEPMEFECWVSGDDNGHLTVPSSVVVPPESQEPCCVVVSPPKNATGVSVFVVHFTSIAGEFAYEVRIAPPAETPPPPTTPPL